MSKNKISPDSIGRRLTIVRTTVGINQDECANILGIHRVTLNNYELNKRKPSDGLLKLFASSFDTDYEWLVSGKGVPYSGYKWPTSTKYDRDLLCMCIVEFEKVMMKHKEFNMNHKRRADCLLSLYEVFEYDQQEERAKQNNKDLVIHPHPKVVEAFVTGWCGVVSKRKSFKHNKSNQNEHTQNQS